MNRYESYYLKFTKSHVFCWERNIWLLVFLFILSSFETNDRDGRIDKNNDPILSFDEYRKPNLFCSDCFRCW